jgi:hypothetical protein
MSIKPVHPNYAAIERQLRHAHVERVPVIAEAIASFIVGCCRAFQAPAAPAATLIDRRRESLGSMGRVLGRPGATH